jgi:hypothetical protein
MNPKIPNSQFQKPPPIERQNSNRKTSGHSRASGALGNFEFGGWNLLGIWNLELGI